MTRAPIAASLAAVTLLASAPATARVRTQVVDYRQGDTVLEGILAFDDAQPGRRPGVVVVHDWSGVGPNVQRRAELLAGLGYVALAADIYGKGVRPKDPAEAAKTAGKYKADRALLRARARAALDFLAADPRVDPARLAAIGYCFGGGTALELARSGAPLKAVASFHGFLDTPDPADARAIKGKVLALHGGDDPYVPAAHVAAFEDEMRAAGVDWQLIVYGGAVHGFTVPESGSDRSKGAAYDAQADRRSWEALKAFFAEAL